MSLARRVSILLGMLLSAGCQEAVHDRPEIASGAAVMRLADPIPEGSVPRGPRPRTNLDDPAQAPGSTVDLATLRRGQSVYQTFCVSCHGPTGSGNGIVVRRGFPAPRSFHEPPLQDITRRRIFEVITLGYGQMASFAERIAPADRWATAAYVKTLQLALDAPALEPPEETVE